MDVIKNRDFGLVLSGGGARAVAHIGMLKAFEEMGLKPAAISGTSAGALIGVLYAAGYSAIDILNLVKEEGGFSVSRFLRYPTGLFSSENLRRILNDLIPVNSFSSLLIPVVVTATDLISGSAINISNGALYDAVIGSCSIPSIFSPVPFNGHLLVDGGILNNLPVEPLLGKVQVIIASHVNNLEHGLLIKQPGRLAVLERCFHLAISASVRQQASSCDLLLEPPMAQYSMFDLRHSDELFQIGYQTAIECAAKIKKLLTSVQTIKYQNGQ